MAYNVNAATATTATLSVKRAATIMCLRRVPGPPHVLSRASLGVTAAIAAKDGESDSRIFTVFGNGTAKTFSSGWQILMGQREVRRADSAA